LREERVAEPIQVLFVEDSPDDVDLMLRELQRAGYEPQWRRVDTEAAMRAALAQSTGDIAVIDYSMPHFDAPAALALLAKMAPYLPGVVVSGTVGEDVAVATMHRERNLAADCGQRLARGADRLRRSAPHPVC
jgi:DNA-binding NtrC family response regulator